MNTLTPLLRKRSLKQNVVMKNEREEAHIDKGLN